MRPNIERGLRTAHGQGVVRYSLLYFIFFLHISAILLCACLAVVSSALNRSNLLDSI